MDERDGLRDRLKAYFRMLAVHDPMRGNELVDVLDAYLDAKFKREHEWVGLTDKEILEDDLLRYHFGLNGGAGPVSKKGLAIVAVIEAKLKEKNHGN